MKGKLLTVNRGNLSSKTSELMRQGGGFICMCKQYKSWNSLTACVNSYCFRSPLGARPVVIEDKRTKLFLD